MRHSYLSSILPVLFVSGKSFYKKVRIAVVTPPWQAGNPFPARARLIKIRRALGAQRIGPGNDTCFGKIAPSPAHSPPETIEAGETAVPPSFCMSTVAISREIRIWRDCPSFFRIFPQKALKQPLCLAGLRMDVRSHAIALHHANDVFGTIQTEHAHGGLSLIHISF